jgi:hypothetical protein
MTDFSEYLRDDRLATVRCFVTAGFDRELTSHERVYRED